MGAIMRQKDLLEKLEHEKLMIRQRMQENERVMESRMAVLAQERAALEQKVHSACVTIQKFIRMRV